MSHHAAFREAESDLPLNFITSDLANTKMIELPPSIKQTGSVGYPKVASFRMLALDRFTVPLHSFYFVKHKGQHKIRIANILYVQHILQDSF